MQEDYDEGMMTRQEWHLLKLLQESHERYTKFNEQLLRFYQDAADVLKEKKLIEGDPFMPTDIARVLLRLRGYDSAD